MNDGGAMVRLATSPLWQNRKNIFSPTAPMFQKRQTAQGYSPWNKKTLEQKMFLAYPDYGCQFMVALSTDRVGK